MCGNEGRQLRSDGRGHTAVHQEMRETVKSVANANEEDLRGVVASVDSCSSRSAKTLCSGITYSM